MKNKQDDRNRSGNSGHFGNKDDERKQTSQPGAPNKSNRQTKGNDESGPERERGTKKGSNAV